jgi:repressor of nif and glnA expression
MAFILQQDVERKTLSILKVLSNTGKPVGSRIIAQRLNDYGLKLGERAIRYHLKITDERGLTALVTGRDGRIITEKGLHEIKQALVKDKVGFAISRIELLAFRTDFDYKNSRGMVPVNISLFPAKEFSKALQVMSPIFKSGLCGSNLVAVAKAGQQIGDFIVPSGTIGFATVCSIVVNGTLLKAGIPMDSKFGGLLQMQNFQPVRFTQIIHYSGCSLDPSEIFIKARMTSVREAARSGDGEILANYREIPAICRPLAENVIAGLKRNKIDGVLTLGKTSEKICEINLDLNKIGIVLLGGLNPVAAAAEAGIEAELHSMSTVVDYGNLTHYREIFSKFS